jgi:hypothetical protein
MHFFVASLMKLDWRGRNGNAILWGSHHFEISTADGRESKGQFIQGL